MTYRLFLFDSAHGQLIISSLITD